jgi:hypothetical protein
MTFGDRTVLDTYTGQIIDGGYCWPLLIRIGKVFVVYYADSHNLRFGRYQVVGFEGKRKGQ